VYTSPPPPKWGGKILPKPGIPKRDYKELIYLGRVPSKTTLKSKEKPYHRVQSTHARRLGANHQMLQDIAGDTFAMVEPCLENVNQTYESFSAPKYGEFRDKFNAYGMEFLDRFYGDIFGTMISPEDLCQEVDWSKSGGFTASHWGIRSKGELIKDPNFLKSDHHNNPVRTIPLTTVANKRELKKITDILEKKIRCFFIAEWQLVKSQLRFGKDSSRKLMLKHWSAYGFNPYRGGVHNLALQLLSKRVRFYYDVSGWDKFVPLMQDLYALIRNRTILPEELRDEFEWMVKNTVAFICVLFDGDVILKAFGNASGSGMTTRDNILMHIIIAAAFLAEAYFMKFGKLPDFYFVAEQIVRLFGDDSVFAVDEEFDYVLHGMGEEDGFLNTFFKRYGMKLKFLYGGYDYPIEKMEFLGFRFHKVDGFYLPYYDPVRLAHSFIHTNDKGDTLTAYVSKCFVLAIMAYATEYRDLFIDSYHKLLDSLDPNHLTPELRSFKYETRLNAHILHAFYTGSESSSVDFSFFESTWREEGIKDDFQNVVWSCHYGSKNF